MNNKNVKLDLPAAAIAFFDLDETITDADTDSLWSGWRNRRGASGLVERAWLNRLYRGFRRGAMSIEEYMKFQRFRIGSLDAEEYRAMARAFFMESGRAHIYPGMEDLIRRLRGNGCRVVLLTAQNDFIAAPFAGHLGMDDIIANRFEMKGGRFTGPVKPYCFGEGKAELARAFAGGFGLPLAQCAFFGDSIYDAFFLAKAGFPFAVNPDPMLEERARRANWQILRFETPSAR
jgi:HAD superfamily hydrolase (TIGR01490 family)